MKIEPKLKRFAKKFGVEFRIGKTPKEVDIVIDKYPENTEAIYFGDGVVFVNGPLMVRHPECDINFILCHELAHAVHCFFPLKITKKMYEDYANAVALFIMAHLQLPVSKKMVRIVSKFSKLKRIARR